MASTREQDAAMELAGYSGKECPTVDDQELEAEGVDAARIERVYRYVHSRPAYARCLISCRKIDRRIIPRMVINMDI